MKAIQNDIKHIREYMADMQKDSLTEGQEKTLIKIEYRLDNIESELQTLEMILNGEWPL